MLPRSLALRSAEAQTPAHPVAGKVADMHEPHQGDTMVNSLLAKPPRDGPRDGSSDRVLVEVEATAVESGGIQQPARAHKGRAIGMLAGLVVLTFLVASLIGDGQPEPAQEEHHGEGEQRPQHSHATPAPPAPPGPEVDITLVLQDTITSPPPPPPPPTTTAPPANASSLALPYHGGCGTTIDALSVESSAFTSCVSPSHRHASSSCRVECSEGFYSTVGSGEAQFSCAADGTWRQDGFPWWRSSLLCSRCGTIPRCDRRSCTTNGDQVCLACAGGTYSMQQFGRTYIGNRALDLEAEYPLECIPTWTDPDTMFHAKAPARTLITFHSESGQYEWLNVLDRETVEIKGEGPDGAPTIYHGRFYVHGATASLTLNNLVLSGRVALSPTIAQENTIYTSHQTFAAFGDTQVGSQYNNNNGYTHAETLLSLSQPVLFGAVVNVRDGDLHVKDCTFEDNSYENVVPTYLDNWERECAVEYAGVSNISDGCRKWRSYQAFPYNGQRECCRTEYTSNGFGQPQSSHEVCGTDCEPGHHSKAYADYLAALEAGVMAPESDTDSNHIGVGDGVYRLPQYASTFQNNGHDFDGQYHVEPPNTFSAADSDVVASADNARWGQYYSGWDQDQSRRGYPRYATRNRRACGAIDFFTSDQSATDAATGTDHELTVEGSTFRRNMGSTGVFQSRYYQANNSATPGPYPMMTCPTSHAYMRTSGSSTYQSYSYSDSSDPAHPVSGETWRPGSVQGYSVHGYGCVQHTINGRTCTSCLDPSTHLADTHNDYGAGALCVRARSDGYVPLKRLRGNTFAGNTAPRGGAEAVMCWSCTNSTCGKIGEVNDLDTQVCTRATLHNLHSVYEANSCLRMCLSGADAGVWGGVGAIPFVECRSDRAQSIG